MYVYTSFCEIEEVYLLLFCLILGMNLHRASEIEAHYVIRIIEKKIYILLIFIRKSQNWNYNLSKLL